MGNLDNYIVKIKEKYSNYLNNPEILPVMSEYAIKSVSKFTWENYENNLF